MSDPSYKLKLRRVASQSLFIWIYLFAYPIVMTMVVPRAYREKDPIVLIVLSGFFALLIIPGIAIFRNYWKYSKNFEFSVSRNSVLLLNKATSKVIEIGNSEMESVTICKSGSYRLPWGEFEYLSIVGNAKRIIVPSFIISFSELAFAGLLTEISNAELVQTENIFPIIRA